MFGTVAIWHWPGGYLSPPYEEILDQRDLNFKIKHCQRGGSVFLRHGDPNNQFTALYDVNKHTYTTNNLGSTTTNQHVNILMSQGPPVLFACNTAAANN